MLSVSLFLSLLCWLSPLLLLLLLLSSWAPSHPDQHPLSPPFVHLYKSSFKLQLWVWAYFKIKSHHHSNRDWVVISSTNSSSVSEAIKNIQSDQVAESSVPNNQSRSAEFSRFDTYGSVFIKSLWKTNSSSFTILSTAVSPVWEEGIIWLTVKETNTHTCTHTNKQTLAITPAPSCLLMMVSAFPQTWFHFPFSSDLPFFPVHVSSSGWNFLNTCFNQNLCSR